MTDSAQLLARAERVLSDNRHLLRSWTQRLGYFRHLLDRIEVAADLDCLPDGFALGEMNDAETRLRGVVEFLEEGVRS